MYNILLVIHVRPRSKGFLPGYFTVHHGPFYSVTPPLPVVWEEIVKSVPYGWGYRQSRIIHAKTLHLIYQSSADRFQCWKRQFQADCCPLENIFFFKTLHSLRCSRKHAYWNDKVILESTGTFVIFTKLKLFGEKCTHNKYIYIIKSAILCCLPLQLSDDLLLLLEQHQSFSPILYILHQHDLFQGVQHSLMLCGTVQPINIQVK